MNLVDRDDVYPLEDWVLVRPEDGQVTLASGLVVPEGDRDKRVLGEVIATGPGVVSQVRVDGIFRVIKRAPMDVQPGDRVLYQEYMGTEIHADSLDGEERLLLLKQGSIEAIVQPGVEVVVQR